MESRKKFNILDSFNDGARTGLSMSFKSMLPGLIFAYAIMQVLTITNIINIIEVIFRPVMILFGLPGITAPALLFGLVSTSGGLGIVANLFSSGAIDAKQVAMLLAGIMCLGATVQYIGRVLGVIEIKSKYYPLLIIVNIVNALIAITIMRFIV